MVIVEVASIAIGPTTAALMFAGIILSVESVVGLSRNSGAEVPALSAKSLQAEPL